MSHPPTKRVLFAGYAPVHFLCFRPIYERLVENPQVEVVLSGGFRQGKGADASYRLEGFYEPFGIPAERTMPADRLGGEEFDVLVCAHLSDSFFPRAVGHSVQIFHGVSFKNLAVREKALRYDTLCLPGRYHAELYARAGLIRPGGARCLLTGFPKVDALVNGEIDREDRLRGIGLDPDRPTLLFAPTGEKNNALEGMGIEILDRFGTDGRFNLLVKPHDHPKRPVDWFAALAPFESETVRLVRDPDVVPWLAAADLLMTDASSVAVEYTLLDRPIVFLDAPKLFKRVCKRAPAMDLETYGRKIGRIVERPEDAVGVVAECLDGADPASESRRAMARHVFHAPGGAAARAAGVILWAAGLEPDLPRGVEALEPIVEDGPVPAC